MTVRHSSNECVLQEVRSNATLICVLLGPNVFIPSGNKQEPPKNLRTHLLSRQREARRLWTHPKGLGSMGKPVNKRGRRPGVRSPSQLRPGRTLGRSSVTWAGWAPACASVVPVGSQSCPRPRRPKERGSPPPDLRESRAGFQVVNVEKEDGPESPQGLLPLLNVCVLSPVTL